MLWSDALLDDCSAQRFDARLQAVATSLTRPSRCQGRGKVANSQAEGGQKRGGF